MIHGGDELRARAIGRLEVVSVARHSSGRRTMSTVFVSTPPRSGFSRAIQSAREIRFRPFRQTRPWPVGCTATAVGSPGASGTGNRHARRATTTRASEWPYRLEDWNEERHDRPANRPYLLSA